MKKFCLVFFAALTAIVGVFFGGCWFSAEEQDDTYYEVATIEDLYDMKSNKKYKLTCDIDLEGREWQPLKVLGFDGTGHTISNCKIMQTVGGSETSNSNIYAGFFSDIEHTLENVTFDNVVINVSVPESYEGWNYFGFAAGWVGLAENVTVRNCKANCIINNDSGTMFGSICGYAYGYENDGSICSEVSNCYAEDCEILIAASKTFLLYLGGIVGEVFDVAEGCTVKNLNITSNCGYIGGIVGAFGESIEQYEIINCVAMNSTITVHSANYNVDVGGICGYCANKKAIISNCASLNNSFNIKSAAGYKVGGVVGNNLGKTTNCLSDSNHLSGDKTSTKATLNAGIGGVCGSAEGTISKCVSQNNTLTGTYSTAADGITGAGVVAKSNASIVNCAVLNNTVSGLRSDIFSGSNKLIYDSYIVDIGQTTPNTNKLPQLSEDEWRDIIETLSLDKKLWTMSESGNLSLNIVN